MNDLELMYLLQENGYEASAENLAILKEELAQEANGPELEKADAELNNEATLEKEPTVLKSNIKNSTVYADEEVSEDVEGKQLLELFGLSSKERIEKMWRNTADMRNKAAETTYAARAKNNEGRLADAEKETDGTKKQALRDKHDTQAEDARVKLATATTAAAKDYTDNGHYTTAKVTADGKEVRGWRKYLPGYRKMLVNKHKANITESYNDYELYQILEFNGYKTTNKNLDILKEGLITGDFIIE